MAGILDSDFMRFLTNNSGYWEQRDRAKAAEQFKGLLGSLEQQGPTQPGQGLLGARAPDEQFWLQAAAIPGYEGIAGQQLGYGAAGTQAMNRQMQAQDYEANNLSMMQQAQLALQQKRDQFAEYIGYNDLERKWYGTQASAGAANASAANSQMSGLLSQARLQEQLQKNQNANGPLYAQLPPVDRMKVNQSLLRNDAAVASTSEVLDWVMNRDPSAPVRGIGTARGGAMAADWMLSALPVMKDMVGAGALDNSEREWMEGIVQNPDALHLTEKAENQFKLIAQKVKDYRAQQYQAVGLPVPEIKSRGAVSRSQGAQPQGQLRPYNPGGR